MKVRIPSGVAAGWRALAHIVLGRLVILFCLLLALSALFPRDEPAFYAFIGLAFVINIPYALWLRDARRIRESAPLQFVVDALIVTGLVYLTGGIDSELCLLYPLVIVSAGIVGGGWLAARVTLLSVCLYALVIVLQVEGVPGIAMTVLPENPVAVIQRLLLRVVVFVFFSAASTFLASRCRFQARELRSYRELVEAVFRHVQVALFVCRDDGTIVLANPAAERLIGLQESSLLSRNIREFLPAEAVRFAETAGGGDRREQAEADGEEKEGGIFRVRRTNGGTFPAAVAAARARLPRTVVRTSGKAGSVWVVALHDLTDAERAREAEKRVAEMQGALKMAGEMAHMVRNPLTTLQAGVEALVATVQSLARGAGENAAAGETTERLADAVLREMARLDKHVEEFLQVASVDPGRFLEGAAARHMDVLESGRAGNAREGDEETEESADER